MSKHATLTEQEFCDLSRKTMNKGYSPEEMRPFYKALAPYLQRNFPREAIGEAALSEQGFYKLWHKAHGVYCHDGFDGESSTALCHLIQPYLQGEFPRAAVGELTFRLVQSMLILEHSEESEGEKHAGRNVGRFEFVDAIERLCTGVESSDKIGQRACLTCGGSKEVCESYRMQNCDLQGTGWDPRKCRVEIDAKRCSLGMNYLSEPCPDCAEKVKVPNVCPTNWIAPKVQTSSEKPLREHRFVDQRERQQRKGTESTSVQYYPGGTDKDSYAAFSYCGWHCRPDRREGDRRSKILTGSLKAMRPQE